MAELMRGDVENGASVIGEGSNAMEGGIMESLCDIAIRTSLCWRITFASGVRYIISEGTRAWMNRWVPSEVRWYRGV